MDEKINPRIFQLLAKVVAIEIQEVISLYGNITSEAIWQKFDLACEKASSSLNEVMTMVPEGREWIDAGLKQIYSLRTEGFIKWQMTWREAEAIANPKGFYGQMRARRLEMEGVIRRAEHAPLN